MHNLKGFDGHLIVKALSEFREVRVIPQNMEKYLSFTVDRLKFIDSLQFTSQSLDSLVKTLEVDEFKYVREAFPIQHEFDLIKRKVVYPYDYMDSFTRFDESRLPSQDAFFSKLSDSLLSDSPCSDMEYAHTTQVNGRLPQYVLEVRRPTSSRLLWEVSCILLITLQSGCCTLLHHSRSHLGCSSQNDMSHWNW